MRINITLGHNSSAAIFNSFGKCLCAYEEERLTKVKSDSSFPKLAIEKCLEATNTLASDIKHIGISHWFSTHIQANKYCDPAYLRKRFHNATIEDNMTHHDDHALSVWNFSGTNSGLTVVIDGFGNDEEVISVYRDCTLIHRVHGYENSLGLMYQYATSAAGLKENEDEYKLLGYEIYSNIVPEILDMPSIQTCREDRNSLIPYNKLEEVKKYWHSKFVDMSVNDIARTVQYNLELKVLSIICTYYNPGELLQLSGGVFYNVKLNNAIMRGIDGKVCVNPVCGDQGNVFSTPGLYYESLALGIRNIKSLPIELKDYKHIHEVFRGYMEFGPRALCNTSTIALPTMENVETINRYNNRNTVMPMAPVVTREFFLENFNDTDKVYKSEKYMVISFDFKAMKDEWRGGAHYDPIRNVYTGRVQVVDRGEFIYDYVRNAGGIMINTSLNYHGTPILFDDDDLRIYQINKNKIHY